MTCIVIKFEGANSWCTFFAEAKNFPIKPVIGVLNGKGPIKVVTRKTETLLPEEGRAPELAEFVRRCHLD